MTWEGLDDKLGAEVVKSRGLEKELSEVKDTLQKESNEHDNLRIAVQLVCDELELALEQETSLLAVRATRIMDRAHNIARRALHFGIHRSFMITRSHYENINLATMSLGFAPVYTDAELENIEKEVALVAHDLSAKIEDEIIPLRGYFSQIGQVPYL